MYTHATFFMKPNDEFAYFIFICFQTDQVLSLQSQKTLLKCNYSVFVKENEEDNLYDKLKILSRNNNSCSMSQPSKKPLTFFATWD